MTLMTSDNLTDFTLPQIIPDLLNEAKSEKAYGCRVSEISYFGPNRRYSVFAVHSRYDDFVWIIHDNETLDDQEMPSLVGMFYCDQIDFLQQRINNLLKKAWNFTLQSSIIITTNNISQIQLESIYGINHGKIGTRNSKSCWF